MGWSGGIAEIHGHREANGGQCAEYLDVADFCGESHPLVKCRKFCHEKHLEICMGAAAGGAGSGWHNCRATAGGLGGLAGHPPISYFLWHEMCPMLYAMVFMGTIMCWGVPPPQHQLLGIACQGPRMKPQTGSTPALGTQF